MIPFHKHLCLWCWGVTQAMALFTGDNPSHTELHPSKHPFCMEPSKDDGFRSHTSSSVPARAFARTMLSSSHLTKVPMIPSASCPGSYVHFIGLGGSIVSWFYLGPPVSFFACKCGVFLELSLLGVCSLAWSTHLPRLCLVDWPTPLHLLAHFICQSAPTLSLRVT